MTGLSVAVLAVLTTWAERFEGKCPHPDRAQYGRPRDLRSGCLECTAALDGWEGTAPCDLCERPCQTGGAWSLPAEQTGAVQLLVRVCDRCDVHRVDDEDEMENRMNPCPMCLDTLRAARVPAAWKFHASCLRSVAGRRALLASGVRNPDDERRVRIHAVRARFEGRAV